MDGGGKKGRSLLAKIRKVELETRQKRKKQREVVEKGVYSLWGQYGGTELKKGLHEGT